MRRIFWGFCRNWFLLSPLHYLSGRSDFGFEFAEIFVLEKWPDSGQTARQCMESMYIHQAIKVSNTETTVPRWKPTEGRKLHARQPFHGRVYPYLYLGFSRHKPPCIHQCSGSIPLTNGSGFGSGSISLTNGSGCGSGRPKNIWILRIRMRIRNTGIHVMYPCTSTLVRFLPLSSTRGAWGPMSMATAPAPPLGRAAPAAYTAISAHTASASRPSHALTTRISRL